MVLIGFAQPSETSALPRTRWAHRCEVFAQPQSRTYRLFGRRSFVDAHAASRARLRWHLVVSAIADQVATPS